MRFPSFIPHTPEQNAGVDVELKTREEMQNRTKAIETLQKRLKDNTFITPEIRTATLKALIALMESEAKDKYGELVESDNLHFSENKEESARGYESAANESDMQDDKKIA